MRLHVLMLWLAVALLAFASISEASAADCDRVYLLGQDVTKPERDTLERQCEKQDQPRDSLDLVRTRFDPRSGWRYWLVSALMHDEETETVAFLRQHGDALIACPLLLDAIKKALDARTEHDASIAQALRDTLADPAKLAAMCKVAKSSTAGIDLDKHAIVILETPRTRRASPPELLGPTAKLRPVGPFPVRLKAKLPGDPDELVHAWIAAIPLQTAHAIRYRADDIWDLAHLRSEEPVGPEGRIVSLRDVQTARLRLGIAARKGTRTFVDGEEIFGRRVLRVPLRKGRAPTSPTDVHVLEPRDRHHHHRLQVAFHRELGPSDFDRGYHFVEIDLTDSPKAALLGVVPGPDCVASGVDSESVYKAAEDQLRIALAGNGRVHTDFRGFATLVEGTQALQNLLAGGTSEQGAPRGREELGEKLESTAAELWRQGARDLIGLAVGCSRGDDARFIVIGRKLDLGLYYRLDYDSITGVEDIDGLLTSATVAVRSLNEVERAAKEVIHELYGQPHLAMAVPPGGQRIHQPLVVRVDVVQPKTSSETKATADLGHVGFEAFQLSDREAERICPMLSRGAGARDLLAVSPHRRLATGADGDYTKGVCNLACSDEPARKRRCAAACNKSSRAYHVWPRSAGTVLVKARLYPKPTATREPERTRQRGQRRGYVRAFVDRAPKDRGADSGAPIDTVAACVEIEAEPVEIWTDLAYGGTIPLPEAPRNALGFARKEATARESQMVRARVGAHYHLHLAYALDVLIGVGVGFADTARAAATLPSWNDLAAAETSDELIRWKRRSFIAAPVLGITTSGCHSYARCSRFVRRFVWQLTLGLEVDVGVIDARATPDQASDFRGGRGPRQFSDVDFNLPISFAFGWRAARRLWAGAAINTVFTGLDDLAKTREDRGAAKITYDGGFAWLFGFRMGWLL